MKITELYEDGVIVPGVNTTPDVKPGETERQAKKFFGGNGKPKPLGVKGATPNQAFNLGLAENMSVTGTERRRLEKKKVSKLVHLNGSNIGLIFLISEKTLLEMN